MKIPIDTTVVQASTAAPPNPIQQLLKAGF